MHRWTCGLMSGMFGLLLVSCAASPPVALEHGVALAELDGNRVIVRGTVHSRGKGTLGIQNELGHIAMNRDLLEGLDGKQVEVVGTLGVHPVSDDRIIRPNSTEPFSPIGKDQVSLYFVDEGAPRPIELRMHNVTAVRLLMK